MSEEEILKECTELAENEHHELGNCWDEEYSSSAIFGLIMLYKQTKKELNNLKEIEKSHKEENGKLRIEFEKVYEDNLTLAQELEQEKEKNKNIGKLVKNKIDGTIGVVLREWETGQIQVLENIQPKIINTHDSWKTLEVIENE